MTNHKQYLPFALVAVVASGLGWGASSFMNRETTSAMISPTALPTAQQPVANQVALPAAQNFAPVNAAAPVNAPVNAEVAAPAPPLVVYREAPVARTVAAPPVRVARTDDESAERPVLKRKKGMSNKAKTAIAIGGSAGVGAAIGGIAGGGKGAAIGAIAGAGAGTIYSVIRNKQNKPVF